MAEAARFPTRYYVAVLVVILAVPAVSFAIVAVAPYVAELMGCRLQKMAPCMIDGADWGPSITALAYANLFAFPLILLGAVIGIAVLAFGFVRHRRAWSAGESVQPGPRHFPVVPFGLALLAVVLVSNLSVATGPLALASVMTWASPIVYFVWMLVFSIKSTKWLGGEQ